MYIILYFPLKIVNTFYIGKLRSLHVQRSTVIFGFETKEEEEEKHWADQRQRQQNTWKVAVALIEQVKTNLSHRSTDDTIFFFFKN